MRKILFEVCIVLIALLAFGCISPPPEVSPSVTQSVTINETPEISPEVSLPESPIASPIVPDGAESDADLQDEFDEIYSDLDAIGEG